VSLIDELKRFEGEEAGPPMVGPDPVNEPMIRHWCEAMGDDLPVYTDPAAAATSVHGGLIAPPTMLQAWVMFGLRRPDQGGNRYGELLALLDRNGYSSVVATNCEQEYLRELRPGDRISVASVIEHISEEKRTALGAGHFVTSAMRFSDQHGQLVGTQRWRVLKFKPPGR
jgi:hypothetical protein